jgi:hypothetical protein
MDNGYKSFSSRNKSQVISSHNSTINSFDSVIHKTTAFSNEIITDLIVRQPYSRTDYDHFRPNEAIPTQFKELVKMCRASYFKMGIIRNVIDLMTDFICDGFSIIDPDKEKSKFFKAWMKQTEINDTIEEFVRHLLIDANVVVKRVTAKLTKPVETSLTKSIAAPDIKLLKEKEQFSKKEIPWRYIFLNIVNLDWVGGEVSKFTGNKQLSIRLSPALISAIRANKDNKELLSMLPNDFKTLIDQNTSAVFNLDMHKLYIAQGKKDSWESWAPPPLESILSDVLFKQKLRQAEISALDGMINVIRLWKLGDHKEGILPDQGAVDKLLNILQANTGGGAMDLVWDTMIEMTPFYPPVDKILGSDKYEQVNKDILIGLGVPEVLLGGRGANFSNSFIQLKTLVEKLDSIRRKLIHFLENELSIVCKAMGYDSLPVIKFSSIADDESTTKKLVIGLLDRGIVSAESVLEIYGHDFELETTRIKKEAKQLEIKGPFDNDKEVAPNGRPSFQKDTTKRKTRVAKPRTKAIKAMTIIDSIDSHYIPIYIASLGVKNSRQLTSDQKTDINNIREYILACIKDTDNDFSEDGLISIINENRNPNILVLNEIKEEISSFMQENNEQPTLSQRKLIESLSWAKIIENGNEDCN